MTNTNSESGPTGSSGDDDQSARGDTAGGSTGAPGLRPAARGPRPMSRPAIFGGRGPGGHGSAGGRGTAGPGASSSSSTRDQREQDVPDSYQTARTLGQLGVACANGYLSPAQARASAGILKSMDDVLARAAPEKRASKTANAAAAGADAAADADGRPSPGAPRTVPAEIMDLVLDLAMAHEPESIQEIERFLDADQFQRATDFIMNSCGPNGAGDGGL